MNLPLDKPVIGLVGGVGSGKSTAAAEFALLGCVVIDGDAIGHDLLAEPEVQSLLRQQWGVGIFNADGSVNRKALGEIAFASVDALARLNGIMHPQIRRRIELGIEQARRDDRVTAIVLDAAILLEAGWDNLCSHLVFVQAPDDARAKRVAQARRWDRANWQARENSQIPLDKKAVRCQYTLDNSSSAFSLREQVRQLYFLIVHAADGF